MRKRHGINFTVKACSAAWLFLALTPVLAAAEPSRDILGIRLNMTRADAQKRLHEMGKFVRDERKRQEIWEVRDARFSHLVVGFDAKEKLRYVTAVAREDKEAKRVEYGEIGNLTTARQAGDPKINNFSYEWVLAAEKDEPATLVNARGRDPKFLSTYSLKRTGESDAEEAGEEK